MLKKTEKYMALSAACMLMLSACSSEEPLSVADNEGKTPIELTVGITGESPSATTRGESSPVTRSVVTLDNNDNNKALAFAKGTSLYMVMESEKNNGDPTYTRTIGYAQKKVDDNNTTVNFATAYGRFWEDSHSRNSQLSVYSVCVPGYYLEASKPTDFTANGTTDGTTWTIGNSTSYDNSWGTDKGTATVVWPLREANVGTQTADFISNQDLCFSNNVSKYTINEEVTDNRVVFNESSKKFGSGRLVFYHALTWVTFKIKKGEGFTTDDHFAFSNDNENIVLKGFNTSGTFNIVDGEFKTSDPGIGTNDITSMALTDHRNETSPEFQYELNCLMLPGTDLNGTDKDDLEKISFTIDNNLYHLRKSDLKNALIKNNALINTDKGTVALTSDYKMRPGVHYIFTMTVGKQKMEKFTAAVVDWETVTAEETTPTNARIQVSLLEDGDKKKGEADFDLFRSTNVSETIDDNFESYTWDTGYAPTSTPAINKALLIENTTNSGIYTAEEALNPHTAWYWPNNKTFYHFRTVLPKTTDTWKVTEDGTGGDYIILTAGLYIAENNEGNYKDVCWGAPFKVTTGKLTYDYKTYGFDGSSSHQISKAIGPTTGTINMEMFHMMSDVTINLTTSEGTDKVTLTNATMELSNIYSTGKVLMGNGLVTPTGTAGSVNNTVNSANENPWHYGFIPQSLENVVLTITADNNQYIVDMKDVVATSVSNKLIANPYTETAENSAKYTIDRWYPNFKYIYTFKLTKTGIAQITATLANWEEVIAGNDNVQIK